MDHLAWPTVALIIFFVLRKQIGRLIGKIAHLKYKDLEVDFDQLMKTAQAVAVESDDSIIPKDNKDKQLYLSMEEQIMESIETAPSASILLAWSTVETAISSAVSRLAISSEPPSYRSPLHNIDVLEKHSKLSKDQIRLLNEMRMLRNKVAHEDGTRLNVTENQARTYANTSLEIIESLNKIKRQGKIIITPKGNWSQKPKNFKEIPIKEANAWMYSSIPIPNTNLTAGLGPWKKAGQEDTWYECYGIDIERPTKNGSMPVAELIFALDFVSDDVLDKTAPELITYDESSKEITFDLGKSKFKYQLQ